MDIVNALILTLMAALLPVLALRKVQIATANLNDNAGSFTNLTSDRLHIRKMTLRVNNTSTNSVIGDIVTASVDEIPVSQDFVNDSRSHIMGVEMAADGATGSIKMRPARAHMEFNKNDLVLETDEAIFLNTTDIVGTPTVRTKLNMFYEAI